MIKCLVLCSAAYEIFLQISALKILIDKKYIIQSEIKEYFCTSSGSIVAFSLMLGLDFDIIYEYLLNRPWHKLLNIDANKLINSYSNCGIFDKEVFIKGFTPLFKLANLELNISLREFNEFNGVNFNIFCSDTNTFKKKIFNYKTAPELSLLDAIYMSCSIPFLFKPMRYKDVIYNDGALLIRFPINYAIENTEYEENEIMGLDIDQNNLQMKMSDDNLVEYIMSYLVNYITKNILSNIAIKNDNIRILKLIPRLSDNKSYIINLVSDKEFREKCMLDIKKDVELFLENQSVL